MWHIRWLWASIRATSAIHRVVAEQHRSIAQKLFLDQPDSHWSWNAQDLSQLKDVMRNHIGMWVNSFYDNYCDSSQLVSAWSGTIRHIERKYRRWARGFSIMGRRIRLYLEARLITFGVCVFLSCIANLFYTSRNLEKIQSKFPWYKQMHALMGTSPVINRSAIAHSATPLDTSMLARNGAVCYHLCASLTLL